jgi:hypothetical protein
MVNREEETMPEKEAEEIRSFNLSLAADVS